MKILFAASECMPFAKTGGLADVVGALPKALADKGEDVRVIMPLYDTISDDWRSRMQHLTYFYVNMGWRRQYVGIETLVYNGIRYYFVDNKQYFGRGYVYGMGGDEGERFAYFCLAVLETLPQIDFFPDILHCNDWQTGLIPTLLKAKYSTLAFYSKIRTVFTVHNLQYQGVFGINDVEELLSLGMWAYTSENLEFYGGCSYIKGGLVFSDWITTVSPTYAKEIQSAYYGEKLDGLLRKRSDTLTGILNGIDTGVYDPRTDRSIPYNYSVDTIELRAKNKQSLCREMGLDMQGDAPLIGMVGRLSGQKGLDLVDCVLQDIINTGAQLVVLGIGDTKYTDLFSWAQWKYPGRVAACFRMDHTLAHKIYAGCDLFLMPSMFEPCGLSQMIAMRYGAIPITRETGGLRDTVLSYNEETGEGNGFTFLNYNAHDMLHTIERAVDYYRSDRTTWRMLQERAMNGDYGWDNSADKYIEVYKKVRGIGK